MQGELVRIGTLTRPHGVRGELAAQPEGEALAALHPGDSVVVRLRGGRERSLGITGLRPDRDRWLVKLEGIADRTAAEDYRAAELLVAYEQLPELDADEFYQADLIGMRVVDVDGAELGTLEAIIETGAHDVYQVVDERGIETLIPAVKAFIEATDVAARTMTVRLLEGMRDAD